MKEKYTSKNLLLTTITISLLIISSCKKDNKNNVNTTTQDATPTKIGLYGYGGMDNGVEIDNLAITVQKVGTQTINDDLIFDTGSSGMVIDAKEVLPPSLASTSGFSFSGDSTVSNGITITNLKDSITYGDDSVTTKVYGNLAYASVTIGDQNGNLTIKRLPFFVYYKVKNSDGTLDTNEGDFDVFGVSPESGDISFSNGVQALSPLTYTTPGKGLTSGFKLAKLDQSSFLNNGGYLPDALTVGLTSSDLSTTGGFAISQLRNAQGVGYIAYISATLDYNGSNSSILAYFDTGTSAPYDYIELNTASRNITKVASNSTFNLTEVGASFTYNYTTTANDQIFIENPSISKENISIFGLGFFFNNEYLLDYTDHELGLKNN